jgi:hypothetical protein
MDHGDRSPPRCLPEQFAPKSAKLMVELTRAYPRHDRIDGAAHALFCSPETAGRV